METQKTPKRQSIFGREEWSWLTSDYGDSLTSDYTTKLQSSRQYVLAQKQKSDQRNKIEILKITCVPMSTLLLTKEARIYSGEKTVSIVNGSGKTGQLCLKQWN